MSYIRLYTEENFSGVSVPVTADTPDLALPPYELSNRALSLVVVGDPWVVYTETNSTGDYRLYKEGNYPTLEKSLSMKISSLRKVKGGLSDPTIVLYDGINHQGRPLSLAEETPTLNTHAFKKKAASLTVPKGAWQLFAADDFKGDNVAVLSGDDLADLQTIGWFHKICSLKPYV